METRTRKRHGLLSGLASRIHNIPTTGPEVPAFRPGFVTELLDRRDRLPEETRTRPGYVHVSALLDMCTRRHVIGCGSELAAMRSVTGGHKVMWRIGRAVEHHVRTELIAALGFSGVYGGWECRCGHSSYSGLFRMSAGACVRCGTASTHYTEHTLRDTDALVVGNPDILLFLDKVMVPVEIKSMNGPDFDKLSGPLGGHVFQAAAYRRLAKLCGFAVGDTAILLYVTKKFKWGSPYKEYHIDCTEAATEARLDLAWGDAVAIRDSMARKIIPSREMCASPTCSRAKQCEVVAECFSRAP